MQLRLSSLLVRLFAILAVSTAAQHSLRRNRPPSDTTPVVVLVTATWNNDNIETETKGFLLSMLEAEPGPVHVVFVTDKPASQKIEKWFSSCNTENCVCHNVTYDTRIIPESEIVQEIAEYHLVGNGPLEHHSQLAGTTKFFLATVLSGYKRAIVYDTDVLLRAPISKLWRAFEFFKPKQLWASTILDQRDKKFRLGICSCLSLFDFDKMRKFEWTIGSAKLRRLFAGANLNNGCASMDNITNASLLAKSQAESCKRTQGYHAGSGDQGLNTFVFNAWPEHFGVLDQKWMLSKCQGYFGVTKPKTLPKLHPPLTGNQEWYAVHFNCGEASPKSPWGRVAKHFYQRSRTHWQVCRNRMLL